MRGENVVRSIRYATRLVRMRNVTNEARLILVGSETTSSTPERWNDVA